jgi:hypothetical protein
MLAAPATVAAVAATESWRPGELVWARTGVTRSFDCWWPAIVVSDPRVRADSNVVPVVWGASHEYSRISAVRARWSQLIRPFSLPDPHVGPTGGIVGHKERAAAVLEARTGRLAAVVENLDITTAVAKVGAGMACNSCGSGHDDMDMVVCDRCEQCYHLRCVQLQRVPKGNWFCPACKLDIQSESSWQGNKRPRRLDSGHTDGSPAIFRAANVAAVELPRKYECPDCGMLFVSNQITRHRGSMTCQARIAGVDFSTSLARKQFCAIAKSRENQTNLPVEALTGHEVGEKALKVGDRVQVEFQQPAGWFAGLVTVRLSKFQVRVHFDDGEVFEIDPRRQKVRRQQAPKSQQILQTPTSVAAARVVPTATVSSPICSICFEPFAKLDSLCEIYKLNCGHAFCAHCIANWKQQCSGRLSCPQCRRRFTGLRNCEKYFAHDVRVISQETHDDRCAHRSIANPRQETPNTRAKSTMQRAHGITASRRSKFKQPAVMVSKRRKLARTRTLDGTSAQSTQSPARRASTRVQVKPLRHVPSSDGNQQEVGAEGGKSPQRRPMRSQTKPRSHWEACLAGRNGSDVRQHRPPSHASSATTQLLEVDEQWISRAKDLDKFWRTGEGGEGASSGTQASAVSASSHGTLHSSAAAPGTSQRATSQRDSGGGRSGGGGGGAKAAAVAAGGTSAAGKLIVGVREGTPPEITCAVARINLANYRLKVGLLNPPRIVIRDLIAMICGLTDTGTAVA